MKLNEKERRKSYDPTKSFLVHKILRSWLFSFSFWNWVHHLSVVFLRKIRSWWSESKNPINHNIFWQDSLEDGKKKKLLNVSVNFMNFCFVCGMKIQKGDRKKFINSETDGPFFYSIKVILFPFLIEIMDSFFSFSIAVLLNFRPWSQNFFLLALRWKMIVGESSAISVIAVAARKIPLMIY